MSANGEAANAAIAAGRLELKGALARFKRKGTLEAFDRNLGDLRRVYVRMTPSPELSLFADLVFASGEAFRVFQESTLVNYRDFLEKLSPTGLENFRALVRHVSRALPPDSLDTATREFAEKNAAPERFVSKEELAAYDVAVTRGDAPASRGAGVSAASKAEAEQAFKRFALEMASERAARKAQPNLAGLLLAVVGGALILISLITFNAQRRLTRMGDSRNVMPMIALGGVTGLGLLIAGLLYLKPRDRD